MPDSPSHFKDKDAISHIIEARANGFQISTEIHGVEPSGYLIAAGDAARETAIILPLLTVIFIALSAPIETIWKLLFAFSLGWLIWKVGRSAWLAWFQLERLHRILEQERWEIENHRPQEREELRVLYAAKGLEGKLLEDVLDVLMADNNRVLKIMAEEELGLSLDSRDHPLKQSFGAAIGSLLAIAICLFSMLLWPFQGIFFGSAIVIIFSSLHSAKLSQNDSISAIIWNLGLAAAAILSTYFILQLLNITK